MQAIITIQERTDLKTLTEVHGRSKWFCDKTGLSWESLDRLRKEGQAEESIVKKARSFLKTKEAKLLIESRRAQSVVAA